MSYAGRLPLAASDFFHRIVQKGGVIRDDVNEFGSDRDFLTELLTETPYGAS